jgi:hypothetical protein
MKSKKVNRLKVTNWIKTMENSLMILKSLFALFSFFIIVMLLKDASFVTLLVISLSFSSDIMNHETIENNFRKKMT